MKHFRSDDAPASRLQNSLSDVLVPAHYLPRGLAFRLLKGRMRYCTLAWLGFIMVQDGSKTAFSRIRPRFGVHELRPEGVLGSPASEPAAPPDRYDHRSLKAAMLYDVRSYVIGRAPRHTALAVCAVRVPARVGRRPLPRHFTGIPSSPLVPGTGLHPGSSRRDARRSGAAAAGRGR